MNNTKPIYLLALGALLIALTHMRFGFGFLIFFEAIPILYYLERARGVRAQILLFTFVLVGWSLAVGKIVTEPLPWFAFIGFSLPIAFFKYLPFLSFTLLRKSKHQQWVFPALLVVGEWLQTTVSPFASWGSAAYTQINNLVFLQITSIGGLWILSYAIYFISFQLYLLSRDGFNKQLGVKIILPILVLGLYGTVRLTLAENRPANSITLAAVGTNSTIGGPVLPSTTEREVNRASVLNRMRIASRAGAEVVVWTEAAVGLLPDEELGFQKEVARLTDSLNITTFASYVISISVDPFRYENKYILVDSTGKIQSTYNKHQPVPGEPCTPGVEPHEVYDLEGTNLGGAICYDFDFPALGREIAKAGADIVALPSSDWRGIDPIHTQMASVRSIEGGFSLVRSTRWGLSGVVDPFGRFQGQLSDFDSDQKILLSTVPKQGHKTLYVLLGDWVILLSMLVVMAALYDKYKTKAA